MSDARAGYSLVSDLLAVTGKGSMSLTLWKTDGHQDTQIVCLPA